MTRLAKLIALVLLLAVFVAGAAACGGGDDGDDDEGIAGLTPPSLDASAIDDLPDIQITPPQLETLTAGVARLGPVSTQFFRVLGDVRRELLLMRVALTTQQRDFGDRQPALSQLECCDEQLARLRKHIATLETAVEELRADLVEVDAAEGGRVADDVTTALAALVTAIAGIEGAEPPAALEAVDQATAALTPLQEAITAAGQCC